ncbi:MAG: hypothetical protein IKN91_01210 [Paludibacteraceae bacterium]|nr:hypothetical protein [Paludibacteraceae bacterium]
MKKNIKTVFKYFFIVSFILGVASCASQKTTEAPAQEKVKLQPQRKIRLKDTQSIETKSSNSSSGQQQTIKKEGPKERIKFKPKQ